MQLIDVLEVGNVLGEGIQWHAGSGLWWTDIQSSLLYHRPEGSSEIQTIQTPERVGSFALVENSARLLCAFETGLGFFDLSTARIEWIVRPETLGSGRRFNDGRVDRQGRFWVGTMIEDADRAGALLGEVHCLDRTLEMHTHLSGIRISNSLCWSPDGTTMYFADTPRGVIEAYDFDVDAGVPSDPRRFAVIADGAGPDGAAIDSEGCLWSAQWGGARVVRYRPDGEIDHVLEVPVGQPSCVAFGGADLDELYVTSAREDMDEAACAAEPLAGHVLVYKAPVAGLPEERYRMMTSSKGA